MAKDKKHKPKRSRRSKVQLLPEDLKQQLDQMLRDGRLQQKRFWQLLTRRLKTLACQMMTS